MGLFDPTPEDHRDYAIREALREHAILDRLDPDGPEDRRPWWIDQQEWEACVRRFREDYDLEE
ncbi:hypothetical protein [Brachybacterium phenoliresistens]|uniref:Uncharacterized protein n=2 Tax=Brachybacterium phenoliresistens TaxID=396014 RepID=Z9JVT0_9MICO|nr:hypothetical protein BF93_12240 [Brachybacterium phenoliresistens]